MMSISKAAQDYHEKMFPGYQSKLLETDPEFIERFDNFAFDEVVNQVQLDGRTTMMSHLAYLLGCQGIDEFRAMLPAALNFGVTPVEVSVRGCGALPSPARKRAATSTAGCRTTASALLVTSLLFALTLAACGAPANGGAGDSASGKPGRFLGHFDGAGANCR